MPLGRLSIRAISFIESAAEASEQAFRSLSFEPYSKVSGRSPWISSRQPPDSKIQPSAIG